MNVVTRVVRRVELNDPINSGNIEASSGYVGAEEGAVLGIAELEECRGTFLLLLFTLKS